MTREAEVIELLKKHGWVEQYSRGETLYFKRPGKEGRGISATWNHIPGRFYVFSTSTEFESENSYRPWHIFAVLECGEDYQKAAKRLSELGYGRPRNGGETERSSSRESPTLRSLRLLRIRQIRQFRQGDTRSKRSIPKRRFYPVTWIMHGITLKARIRILSVVSYPSLVGFLLGIYALSLGPLLIFPTFSQLSAASLETAKAPP